MRRIDEQHLKTPFYGYRRMTVCLCEQGSAVNSKRVQRLMHAVMGIGGTPLGRASQAAHNRDEHGAPCLFLLLYVLMTPQKKLKLAKCFKSQVLIDAQPHWRCMQNSHVSPLCACFL